MKIIIALILAAASCTSFADQLVGKVIKVTDGDTVNVLTSDNETHKIRLSGIDAPEKKQAFGNRSKQALADLIDGKIVNVEYNKRCLTRASKILPLLITNSKLTTFSKNAKFKTLQSNRLIEGSYQRYSLQYP